MTVDIAKLVQGIQYVLAPAVMVSSSALLLLGFQNKFSNLASRFRALTHEKRILCGKSSQDTIEKERLQNLNEQIDRLMDRASCVKKAILCAYLAIVCFTGTSMMIFFNVYIGFLLTNILVTTFLLGLLLVFLSAVFMMLEVELFYKVMRLEKKSSQNITPGSK